MANILWPMGHISAWYWLCYKGLSNSEGKFKNKKTLILKKLLFWMVEWRKEKKLYKGLDFEKLAKMPNGTYAIRKLILGKEMRF